MFNGSHFYRQPGMFSRAKSLDETSIQWGIQSGDNGGQADMDFSEDEKAEEPLPNWNVSPILTAVDEPELSFDLSIDL